MSNKVISIEIGLQSIKICEVSLKKNNPRLYRCITLPTPENLFNDGYIRDNNRLAMLLKEKIKEAKINSKRVIFTISSTKIASREVTLPPVRISKIQEIISTNASEYFPVDLSHYTISYRILERVNKKDDKKLRLYLLAAPNKLVENYYDLAKLMGLRLVATDYVGNSSYQILKSQVKEGSSLFIQIGDHSSLISVIDNGILMLQRTISYGEHEFQNQLEEAQAEAATSRISYDGEEDIVTSPIDAKGSITDSHRYFVSNVLRILNYNYSINNKRVHGIYLLGNSSDNVAMDELLYKETGITVKKVETLSNVTFGKKLVKELTTDSHVLTDYLIGIGSSIDPLQFVPSEVLLKAKRQITINNRIALIVGSLVIGIIITITSYLEYRTSLIDQKTIGRDIDKLIDINELHDDYVETKRLYEQMKRIESLSTSPNRYLNDLISELEDKLPEKALVSTMMVTSSDISLNIRVGDKEEAAKTLQSLKNISYIKDIRTNEITEDNMGNDLKIVHFIISTKYDLLKLEEDTKDD